MKIEVGKKYIDARGEVIEIVHDDESENYPLRSEEEYYQRNGSFQSIQDIRDLICEVIEDLYLSYKQDSITKHEFLNHHFELYSGITLEQYNQATKD